MRILGISRSPNERRERLLVKVAIFIRMFWEKPWLTSVDPSPVGRHAAAHFLAEGETRFTPLPPHLARRPDTAATQSAPITAQALARPAPHGRPHFQDSSSAFTSIRTNGRTSPGLQTAQDGHVGSADDKRTRIFIYLHMQVSQTHRPVLLQLYPHQSGETGSQLDRPDGVVRAGVRVCVCVLPPVREEEMVKWQPDKVISTMRSYITHPFPTIAAEHTWTRTSVFVTRFFSLDEDWEYRVWLIFSFDIKINVVTEKSKNCNLIHYLYKYL